MKPGWPRALWIAVALSPLYSMSATSDGVYTWKDANGVVHFSDREPRQGGARQVEPVAPVLVPMSDNLEAAEAVTETVGVPEPATDNRSSTDQGRRDQERQCEKYQQQLDNIQSQLRAGYSNAEGNRLREKRRSLNSRLGRECLLG